MRGRLTRGCLARGCLARICMMVLIGGPGCLGFAGTVHAQQMPSDDDKGAAVDMHQLATRYNTVRVRKDYSYIDRPAGDKVVEQPDIDRLLFWTKEGQPDGYAQRRGDSVVYYDAAGRAVRVQHLRPGEAD